MEAGKSPACYSFSENIPRNDSMEMTHWIKPINGQLNSTGVTIRISFDN